MSVMTRGIIAQPYSLAMHSDYSRRQFYSHAQVLLADHDSAHKHWQNESNNVQALMDEVARLKAENAGLRTGYEAYEQVVQGLKAENEALRVDAERYRWLRNQADAADWEFLSHQSRETVDQNIDCALTPSGKGEQS